MGERKGHSSDTAPNIENLVVGKELSVLNEIAKVFFPGGGKISVAHKLSQPVWW